MSRLVCRLLGHRWRRVPCETCGEVYCYVRSHELACTRCGEPLR